MFRRGAAWRVAVGRGGAGATNNGVAIARYEIRLLRFGVRVASVSRGGVFSASVCQGVHGARPACTDGSVTRSEFSSVSRIRRAERQARGTGTYGRSQRKRDRVGEKRYEAGIASTAHQSLHTARTCSGWDRIG